MRTLRGFVLLTVLCVSLRVVASAADAVQPAVVAPPAQPAAAPKDSVLPAAKPETKPAAAANDPVVCKKVMETGSRTSGKEVCMTASQWQQQKKNARDVMNSIPSNNVGGNAGN